MDNLISITSDNEFPVSGKTLHMQLQVETRYNDWFPRMCEYGFEEEKDFYSKLSESTGGRPAVDHQMTISMAKELCMLQRSETGRQIRRYLIAVEEQWNKPEMVIARALKMADQQITDLKGKVVELNTHNQQLRLESAQKDQTIADTKPKVLFADCVETSTTSILVGDLAKLVKQNGVDIGQNRLFHWMRENDYLIKSGERRNMPTQYSMDLGLLEIKESIISDPNGSVRIIRTPKVSGKGQVYFINKLCAKQHKAIPISFYDMDEGQVVT